MLLHRSGSGSPAVVFLPGGGAVGLDYLNVQERAADFSTSVLWPQETRELLIERHVSPEWLRAGFQEAKNVEQLYDEVRHAGPMPDVPLIILSSMATDGFKTAVLIGESESQRREEIEGKRRLYTALAESVPRGENRPVDAGHVTIHYRCPDAVLEAIQDLLDRLGH
jgi:hypothetical protein